MEKNYLVIHGDEDGVQHAQLALTRTSANDMLWDYVVEYCIGCQINLDDYKSLFDLEIRDTKVGTFDIRLDDGDGVDYVHFFQIYRLGY